MIVVPIIAIGVSFHFGFLTRSFAIEMCFGMIFTLAFLTGFILIHVAVLPTTIASVPIASTIVVPIITTSVSFVFAVLTFAFAIAKCGKFGIFTLALLTVKVLPLVYVLSTAIASVPITSAIVVPIVTTLVSFVSFGFAKGLTRKRFGLARDGGVTVNICSALPSNCAWR